MSFLFQEVHTRVDVVPVQFEHYFLGLRLLPADGLLPQFCMVDFKIEHEFHLLFFNPRHVLRLLAGIKHNVLFFHFDVSCFYCWLRLRICRFFKESFH